MLVRWDYQICSPLPGDLCTHSVLSNECFFPPQLQFRTLALLVHSLSFLLCSSFFLFIVPRCRGLLLRWPSSASSYMITICSSILPTRHYSYSYSFASSAYALSHWSVIKSWHISRQVVRTVALRGHTLLMGQRIYMYTSWYCRIFDMLYCCTRRDWLLHSLTVNSTCILLSMSCCHFTFMSTSHDHESVYCCYNGTSFCPAFLFVRTFLYACVDSISHDQIFKIKNWNTTIWLQIQYFIQ